MEKIRSSSKLEILNRMELRYHYLRNSFPIGLKLLDDEKENKMNWLKEEILRYKLEMGL
jgi:hypothetical protein